MPRTLFSVSTTVFLLAGGLVAPLAPAPKVQPWPSFRGPHATGVALTAEPPTTWDLAEGRNVAWSTPIPGLAHSSPIVWDNRIFLTTAVKEESEESEESAEESGSARESERESGSEPENAANGSSTSPEAAPEDESSTQEWRLYCLDRPTGKILWMRTAHEGIPTINRHAKASHANATPATDGKRVIALMGSEGLFAYDVDGQLLWERDLGRLDVGYVADPTDQWGPASSPIIHGNLVIVQNDRQKDSEVLAFDIRTGEQVWRAGRNELPSWSTPVIHTQDEPILITNSPRYIRGHNPETGKELWKIQDHTGPEADGEVKVVTPVIAGDLIIVTGGYPGGGRPIFAIEPATGNLAWKLERGSPYTPTPIVYQGILYICSDNGILRAYDAKTGQRLYEARIARDAGNFSASAIAAAGRLYLASEEGSLYVVRAGRNFELLAKNEMGSACLATPALAGNMLLVRTRTHLHALAAE